MEKVICLDGWRFDFPKRLLMRAAALLDSGMKPTDKPLCRSQAEKREHAKMLLCILDG